MKLMMNFEESGFRLARLEIYNWGTFDQKIWVMIPEGQTAVLTGANGSGKSTVVDALLTLLVDGRQRNYNLASGAGSSRERTEKTYVTGQYSRSRGESTIEAKANTLRSHDSYSVLLGVFRDDVNDHVVTLVQMLWLSNVDRVEKRFYIGHCELNIEQHFPQRHITSRDLPKGVEGFGSTFKDYIAAARKALGLAGRHKALDLFNETVAVKDIPSLNTFVREHMLDKGEPEARINALRSQYRELNDAHAAIVTAARQLDLLAPLVEAGKEYRRYDEQIQRYEWARKLVPFYVANKAEALLTQKLKELTYQREAEQSRLDSVNAELAKLRREIEDARIAIAQNDIGRMKRDIQSRLPLIQDKIKSLQSVAKRYDDNARRVGLPLYQHEEDFYQNQSNASVRLEALDKEIPDFELRRSNLQLEQHDLIEKGRILNEEIDYLRQNLSKIPAKVAQVRQLISQELNIPLDEMPFVGELLKIRDGEQAWEGVLERLLHSFAQDLIVPEGLYRGVSQFVNEHNLRGRLVYRRVDADQNSRDSIGNRYAQQTIETQAYEKLEIKPDTPYYDWLASNLMQRFAYHCCKTLTEFQQAERAITQQGQIKHSRSHHEKDDRHDLQDTRHYVLGWDNREKLAQLERERDDLSRQLNRLQEQLVEIDQRLNQARNDVRALQSLLEIDSFAEIDWRSIQTEYDRLARQLNELDDSQLRKLEHQLQQLEIEVKDTDARRDDINRQLTLIDRDIKTYTQYLQDAQAQLASATDEHTQLWEQAGMVFDDVDKTDLTLDNLRIRNDELDTSIQRSIANSRGHQTRHASTIFDAMNNFRSQHADEGMSLTTDIAALPAFEAIYTRLQDDDLPRHEKRFKEMLDRTVTRGIQTFYSQLTEQERAIESSIAELNTSLSQVDYGNRTIIRLIAEPNPDPEISEFRRTLRACIPDAGDNSPEELERVYERIKDLINRFDDDPNWMRRVIDVRRWRVFAAEQLDATGRQVDYYNDSSGKSGGQKAKLAYTILASAIAYQYGLQDAALNNLSFRLVVIDEAFSKLDDDNARFAMKLFKQLGLQLLVVTPMQQLHVIEDYVKAYHVVVNNEEGNYSRLFNLTQQEYMAKRRELHLQG